MLLAGILMTPMGMTLDQHLRNVFRDKWGRICALAHEIHDEETKPEEAIKRAAAVLGRDPGNIAGFLECVAAAGFEVRRK
jgi:hypothetical protein